MNNYPEKDRDFVPSVTTEEMAAADKTAIKEYSIRVVQLMENAGHNLAIFTRDTFFDGNVEGKEILVLAGKGHNGGDAMVAARHLDIMGANVRVLISEAKRDFKGAPSEQLETLRKSNVSLSYIKTERMFGNPELVIDGLIGHSLKGAPRGKTSELIGWANKWARNNGNSIISLDVPSGIDTTTGEVYEPVIKARATLTLGLPKEGLQKEGAKEYVGDLYVANIGFPPKLFADMGKHVKDLFATSDIIRIR